MTNSDESGSSSFSLVEPAYYSVPEHHVTFGPEVADLCELASYGPDPEQQLILDAYFGVDKRGEASAFETAIVAARQNVKTGALKQLALGCLFITDQKLIVWSAHLFSTTQEAHRDMTELIMSSNYLSRRVKQIYNSAADKSIELKSGARLVFKARTATGGRGLSAPKVFLDEAFALEPSHIGSLMPAMSAQPDPQVVYASSAGLADSKVLREIRNRGRAGRDAYLAYLEWCAKPGGCEKEKCDHAVGTAGCALDRLENWQAANPLLGRRRPNGTGLSVEHLLKERRAMPPAEFARERLGWWDEPGAAEIFGPGKWEACAGETPAGVRLEAVAVAVTVDLGHAAIVGSGRIGDRVYVQVLAHGPGYDWVPAKLPDARVLVDGKGPAAVLVPDLVDAGVDLFVCDLGQVLDAWAAHFKLVKDGVLLHDRDPLLNEALDGAVERTVGDRSTWGRRTSTSDISPLEAETLAAWWVSLPGKHEQLPPTPPAVAQATTPRNDLMTVGF